MGKELNQKIVNVEMSSLPTEYTLMQNYPNPFNPSTRIAYTLPFQSQVELKIYDVLGREIASLVNKEQPAGNYNVEFNSAELPSGVYLYRIQAGEFSQVRKMILIK